MIECRLGRDRQGAGSPPGSRLVEGITSGAARWTAPDRAGGSGTSADSHELRSLEIEASARARLDLRDAQGPTAQAIGPTGIAAMRGNAVRASRSVPGLSPWWCHAQPAVETNLLWGRAYRGETSGTTLADENRPVTSHESGPGPRGMRMVRHPRQARRLREVVFPVSAGLPLPRASDAVTHLGDEPGAVNPRWPSLVDFRKPPGNRLTRASQFARNSVCKKLRHADGIRPVAGGTIGHAIRSARPAHLRSRTRRNSLPYVCCRPLTARLLPLPHQPRQISNGSITSGTITRVPSIRETNSSALCASSGNVL